METIYRKMRTGLRTAAALTLVAGLIGVSPVSGKQWFFGIGTGLARLNIEGDEGFNIQLQNLGPIQYGVDLAPDDVQDLIESAIGGGGYATDGDWMIQVAYTNIVLGGDFTTTLGNGAGVVGSLSYDVTTVEASVAYPVYHGPNGKLTIRPLVGVRYLKKDISADLTILATTETTINPGQDWNYTDILVGATVDVALSPKVNWSSGFNAGFGGSNGVYDIQTAISWNVYKKLALIPNAFYTAVDFENGSIGDSDWYMYDANEFGWGLSFMINF